MLQTSTNNHVHNIEVNNSSIIHGKEFGVDIVTGLYNFHSHPINAYRKYNVKLGWPSAQDYIGFLLASKEDETIFHLVITLEGIYIISLTKEWVTKKNLLTNKALKFIEKEYNFCYKDGNTISWYLNKINHVKYKDYPIFVVQFLSWNNSTKIFTLHYDKIADNCFSHHSTKKLYKNFL